MCKVILWTQVSSKNALDVRVAWLHRECTELLAGDVTILIISCSMFSRVALLGFRLGISYDISMMSPDDNTTTI